MSYDPSRKTPGRDGRPKIWVDGSQRPPFDLRALGRASLHYAREGVAPIHGWLARNLRQGALAVRDGRGRIPAAKLGRVAPYVPSHLRVAMWVRNLAAVAAHASASADPDAKRGNALVAEIEQHLWPLDPTQAAPRPVAALPEMAEPVTLREPVAADQDPLAAIRGDLGRKPGLAQPRAPAPKNGFPPPPGPAATTAIQVLGWLGGWATAIIALPYGLIRALWAFASGQDLRKIGRED